MSRSCQRRWAGVGSAAAEESQEEILEAALASLTDEDIPPADDEVDGWPDPDFDRPAELAGLDGAELDALAAEVSGPPAPAWPLSFRTQAGPEAWPAGFGPRDRSGDGAGFADGGVLDVLAAGLPLAGFAADAHDRLSPGQRRRADRGAAGLAAGGLMGGGQRAGRGGRAGPPPPGRWQPARRARGGSRGS